VKLIVLGIFCPAMVKFQQFVISKPDEVHHQAGQLFSNSQHFIATSKFVLTAHYDVIITS